MKEGDKKIRKNRFISFLKKRKRFLSFLLSFFAIIGMVSVFLIVLEINFALNSAREHIRIHEDILDGVGELNFRHHPYFDYFHDYQSTKNPCEEEFEDPVTIHMYGGSAMLDRTESDSIPFHLWDILCQSGLEVEVKNLGQAGYVSSQEVSKLIYRLRTDINPDIVVFYDGYNDMGIDNPGYPHMDLTKEVFYYYLHHNRSPFSYTVNSMIHFLKERGLVDETEYELERIDYFSYDFRKTEYENPEKYEPVMEIYLKNTKIVQALEDLFDFKVFFYWQPDLTTKKNLSESEKRFIENPAFETTIDYYENSKETVDYFLNQTDNVGDLRYIFDDYSETMYSDLVHKTGRGNQVVAQEIAKDIIDYLDKD